MDLPTCERCGFQGRRPENVSEMLSGPVLTFFLYTYDGSVLLFQKNTLAYVVPCSLTESLSMSWCVDNFLALPELERN